MQTHDTVHVYMPKQELHSHVSVSTLAFKPFSGDVVGGGDHRRGGDRLGEEPRLCGETTVDDTDAAPETACAELLISSKFTALARAVSAAWRRLRASACATTAVQLVPVVAVKPFLQHSDGWMDGWMDGYMDGWMNRWVSGTAGIRAHGLPRRQQMIINSRTFACASMTGAGVRRNPNVSMYLSP